MSAQRWCLKPRRSPHSFFVPHTIPLFVYILEGELALHGEDGSTRRVKQGDAFMEATDWHFGSNEGSATVRLLAVYPGEVGAPLSIRADP